MSRAGTVGFTSWAERRVAGARWKTLFFEMATHSTGRGMLCRLEPLLRSADPLPQALARGENPVREDRDEGGELRIARRAPGLERRLEGVHEVAIATWSRACSRKVGVSGDGGELASRVQIAAADPPVRERHVGTAIRRDRDAGRALERNHVDGLAMRIPRPDRVVEFRLAHDHALVRDATPLMQSS